MIRQLGEGAFAVASIVAVGGIVILGLLTLLDAAGRVLP